jgi:DNA-binding NarL/FixJ family response regulator
MTLVIDNQPGETNAKVVICLVSEVDVWNCLRQCLGEAQSEYHLTQWREPPAEILRLGRRPVPALLVIEEVAARTFPRDAFRTSRSGLQVLVVSEDLRGSTYREFLEIGCSGVLARGASPQTVRKAIDSIFAGELWAPRKILSHVVQDAVGSKKPPKLTAREAEVLHLIGRGFTNQKIADQMCLSRDTIRWHIRGLYAKIGARDRRGAIRCALGVGEEE